MGLTFKNKDKVRDRRRKKKKRRRRKKKKKKNVYCPQ